MHTGRHKTQAKVSLKNKQASSAPSNKSDEYVAIWVLAKLGWSNRRIARLKLPTSHHTISDHLSEACDQIENHDLPILAKEEKKIRIIPCGSSNDIDYIHGKINANKKEEVKNTKEEEPEVAVGGEASTKEQERGQKNSQALPLPLPTKNQHFNF